MHSGKSSGPAGAAGKKANVFVLAVIAILFLLLPFYVPRYYVYLASTILVTALLAGSLNFILGYGGLLQLHHAVFFGLGAYGAALALTKTAWPFWAGLLAGPAVAAAVAVVIGWFCVRLRGLYFGMLTLALGQLVWAVVYRWYRFTGGDDGIHGVPVPGWLVPVNSAYYLVFIVCAASLLALYIIIRSPFGLTLQAVRDNPARGESVGVDIRRHQLAAFVIAGFFAGVAGVLFLVIERSVSPALLYWSKSAEVLIMCLLGGMFTFFGPVLGAAAIVILSTLIGVFTEYWLIVLGIILLLVVLFLPQGILGFIAEVWSQKKDKGVRADVGGRVGG
ncbi:MAG: branched-chain amino acid ABC transporter permease [Bacillota bacterium]